MTHSAPPTIPNENERLAALRELAIMDTPPETEFDELAALAAQICEAPIGLVTLLDEHREWFKARTGLTATETPRDSSFCAHTIAQRDVLVVNDAHADARFAEGPLVSEENVRSYAGVPLITEDGHAVGTLCVMDRVPRGLRPEQRRALAVLGRSAEAQLALRRHKQALHETGQRLNLAITASGIGLWDWDIAAGTVYFSPEWKAQLGYGEHEIENRFEEWERRLHPTDRERCLTVVRNYLERPWPEYENEFRLRHRNGTYRWILTRAQVYSDAKGRATRMLGCHIDITERRTTEDRLRASREQLRALAAHLQAAREQEATRIARELHDQLGAALTGLNFEVSWIERQLRNGASAQKLKSVRERVRGILELIDRTVGTVRAICVELRPAMLDQLGLATTIGWQASEFQSRTGIRCQVSVPDEVPADPERATAIFRILQEVLTNVARHAKASEVRIELKAIGGEVILTASDNGRGFAADAALQQNRFGLVGMKERAIAAGGSLEIVSASDAGTKVTVRVPASKQGRR